MKLRTTYTEVVETDVSEKCCVGEHALHPMHTVVAETYLIYPIVWKKNFNRDFYCQFALFEKDRTKERKIEKQRKKQNPMS